MSRKLPNPDDEVQKALHEMRKKLPAARPSKKNQWQEGQVVEGAAVGTVIGSAGDTVMVLHADGLISIVRHHEIYTCV